MSFYGGFGYFTLAVKEARDLCRDDVSTRVKASFGKREKRTEVCVGENPSWGAEFTFPTFNEKDECVLEVWEEVEDLAPECIGHLSLTVGGQSNKGSGWFSLEPEPAGEIYLEWTYEYDEESVPVEKALGNLIIEIVKAKGLPLGEYDEPVTSFVELLFGGHGRQTKVRKNTSDPFWNELYEFKVMDPSDQAFMTVCYEDGSPLGSCALNVWFDKENKKGSEWLPIRRADDPTDLGGSKGGTLFVRYKYIAKKRKVEEIKKKDTDIIELGYEPKINGTIGLIPEQRVYVWYQLLENKRFRSNFAQNLMNSFTKREKTKDKVGSQGVWVDVPYESVDAVVEDLWKVETRLRLFNKVRSAATALILEGTCACNPDDETRQWYQWKEFAVMRSEITTSIKVEKTLKALYNVVMYGVEDPIADQITSDTRLNKRTHQILCQNVYCAFLPELSRRLGKKIAAEDWERYDAQHADHSDDSHLFMKLVKEFTSFWCDTITEYEYQTLLGTLVPVLIKAKAEFLDRPGSGKKSRPGSASSKKKRGSPLG
uniref:C2 domain-containing protein n=1 Tax=Eutreptiella gymnastica TaxID=73025 RepID=A0A7S4GLB7_9EUGL